MSTIHKSKGREFDRVILSLPHFSPDTDEKARLLYVAMTRAKRDLRIHYAAQFLRPFFSKEVLYTKDMRTYSEPGRVSQTLNFHDVCLNYFAGCQYAVSKLNCGDKLKINGFSLTNQNGVCVLRFSKNAFKSAVESWARRGYIPVDATVQFMAYWKGDMMEHEILVFFPELIFHRQA